MTSRATLLPPTSLGKRLVRYTVGFTVGTAVGLAPFLGRVKVPLFSALLEIYPVQMQQTLIILSGFLLGMVAVAVQYFAFKASPTALLDRYFGLLLKLMLAALLLLVVLYQTSVVSVPIEKQVSADPTHVEAHRYTLLVGWFRANSSACRCPPEITALDCVEQSSLDPRRVASCWKYLPLFEVVLTLQYLFLLGGFGTLVGLLLLREEEEWRLKRLHAPEPGPTPAAARPRARPSAKAKASAGTKPEPGPDAKGKAAPGAGSEPVRKPRPKPSPGAEKPPGTRRRCPPLPPEEPPEG